MKKIIVRPKLSWILIIDIACVSILLLSIPTLFDSTYMSNVSNLLGGLIVITIFTLVPLCVSFGLLISLKDGTFSRTDYFFSKQKIRIDKINFISYRPNLIFGEQYKTLIICSSFSGHERKIEMSSLAFDEADIQKLVENLMDQNKNIQLDLHLSKWLMRGNNDSHDINE